MLNNLLLHQYNLVPGISVSPDRMLQARLFNYADAQRYRLGVNYQQIPVNAARCPVHSNHRDGQGVLMPIMAAYHTMNQTALVNGKSKRSTKRTPIKNQW